MFLQAAPSAGLGAPRAAAAATPGKGRSKLTFPAGDENALLPTAGGKAASTPGGANKTPSRRRAFGTRVDPNSVVKPSAGGGKASTAKPRRAALGDLSNRKSKREPGEAGPSAAKPRVHFKLSDAAPAPTASASSSGDEIECSAGRSACAEALLLAGLAAPAPHPADEVLSAEIGRPGVGLADHGREAVAAAGAALDLRIERLLDGDGEERWALALDDEGEGDAAAALLFPPPPPGDGDGDGAAASSAPPPPLDDFPLGDELLF